MRPWIQSKFDAATAFFSRHPRKTIALGLAGAWYQAVIDLGKWLLGLLPARETVVQAWSVLRWPDWSVSWITGPIGTLLLLLIWRQTRQQRNALKDDWWLHIGPDVDEARKIRAFPEAVAAIKTATKERDAALQEVAALKRRLSDSAAEVAICKLERLGPKYAPDQFVMTNVTVRFIEFSDGPLADRIVDLFRIHARWPTTRIRDDGSDVRQTTPERVVFESGNLELVRDLHFIFNEGNLLKEPVVGREIRDRGDSDVIVTVFPRTPPA
jgi:hypothetical protein